MKAIIYTQPANARFVSGLLVLSALFGIAGCEPSIKPADLGTPVYDETKLPGAGDPPAEVENEKAPMT
ncbi:MAG TPA: hypothetical protein VGJ26_14140 [Pirellulales bacterium]